MIIHPDIHPKKKSKEESHREIQVKGTPHRDASTPLCMAKGSFRKKSASARRFFRKRSASGGAGAAGAEAPGQAGDQHRRHLPTAEDQGVQGKLPRAREKRERERETSEKKHPPVQRAFLASRFFFFLGFRLCLFVCLFVCLFFVCLFVCLFVRFVSFRFVSFRFVCYVLHCPVVIVWLVFWSLFCVCLWLLCFVLFCVGLFCSTLFLMFFLFGIYCLVVLQ